MRTSSCLTSRSARTARQAFSTVCGAGHDAFRGSRYRAGRELPPGTATDCCGEGSRYRLPEPQPTAHAPVILESVATLALMYTARPTKTGWGSVGLADITLKPSSRLPDLCAAAWRVTTTTPTCLAAPRPVGATSVTRDMQAEDRDAYVADDAAIASALQDDEAILGSSSPAEARPAVRTSLAPPPTADRRRHQIT